MSTYPRTTKCPRTRPPTQYKFLDFSSLQLLLLLFWLKKEQKNTLQLLLLLYNGKYVYIMNEIFSFLYTIFDIVF